MDSRRIARILLGIGAVKLNFNEPFTYASGIRAPIYTDNRLLVSYPQERQEVVDGLLEMVRAAYGGAVDKLIYAGTATAGIPWASFVAQVSGAPMIYVRPKPKDHGTGKQIEGKISEGQTAVVIEDLVTTGGSSLGSVRALRGEGKAKVRDIFAIFTYGFDSMYAQLSAEDVKLSVLTDFVTLLDVAREDGVIDSATHEKILAYKEDPQGWAAKMNL